MSSPWIIPWYLVAPSSVLLMTASAVAAWLIGRASLRRTINREAIKDVEVARLTEENKGLKSANERLVTRNASHRAALRGVMSLAAQEVK